MRGQIIAMGIGFLFMTNSVAFCQTQKTIEATARVDISEQAVGDNNWYGGAVGGRQGAYVNYNLKGMINLAVNQAVIHNPYAVQYFAVTRDGANIAIRAEVVREGNTPNCSLVELKMFQNGNTIFIDNKEVCQ